MSLNRSSNGNRNFEYSDSVKRKFEKLQLSFVQFSVLCYDFCILSKAECIGNLILLCCFLKLFPMLTYELKEVLQDQVHIF